MKKQVVLSVLGFAAAALVRNVPAQPPQAPNTAELLCSIDTAASFRTDTVASTPDANGFYSIFDGKSFKGWWQNCLSTHSQGDRTWGAQWQVDTVRKAIYAMQRNGQFTIGGQTRTVTQVGGLMTTHKKYGNYELIFDWWPDFGNDGGVFNRLAIISGPSVASNQMVLDYLGASGILSYYSEANWVGGAAPVGTRNGRPWSYTGNTPTTPGSIATGDTILAIPGSGGNSGDLSNWTTSTQKLNPTSYGCAVSGCVAADYLRLWPRHGWVSIRQRYYGGLSLSQGSTSVQSPTGSGDKIHEETFFRKYYPTDTSVYFPVPGVSDTAQWIPVVKDSVAIAASQVPVYSSKSWFAFQVHFQGRYRTVAQGGKGSWYRNIRVRELDSLGMPLVVSLAPARKAHYDMRVISGALVGTMDLDHIVTVSDLRGRVLQRISGIAGHDLRYELPAASGVLLVQVKTTRGQQTFRVNRLR